MLSSEGSVTFFGRSTATSRKSPGMNLSSSKFLSSLSLSPTASRRDGSASSSKRGAGIFSEPGSPRMSREYTIPMSFWEKRPLLVGSAYTVLKENLARGCLYSAMWGAVFRRVVRTSRSVASFLVEGSEKL